MVSFSNVRSTLEEVSTKDIDVSVELAFFGACEPDFVLDCIVASFRKKASILEGFEGDDLAEVAPALAGATDPDRLFPDPEDII